MKHLFRQLSLVAVVSCAFLWVNSGLTFAAQESAAGPDQRLQQLEQRINDLSERQDQILRQLQDRPEGQEQMPGRSRFGTAPGGGGPIPFPPAGLRRPGPFAGPPAAMAARRAKGIGGVLCLILLVCLVCNILLAVWIFGDIRKRGEGHGIFIALALVAGVPAAIIYALVRIGDRVSPPAK